MDGKFDINYFELVYEEYCFKEKNKNIFDLNAYKFVPLIDNIKKIFYSYNREDQSKISESLYRISLEIEPRTNY